MKVLLTGKLWIYEVRTWSSPGLTRFAAGGSGFIAAHVLENLLEHG